MKKIIVLILAFSLIFCACAQKEEKVHGFAMDTVINITVPKSELKYAREALLMCADYEKIFSRTDKESELWKVNNEGKVPARELYDLIDFSLYISKISSGAFDITVAPLSDLWSFKENSIPPEKEDILNALKNVGYKKISTEPFSLNGTTLDLGAVAKGYTADKIAEFLREKGVEKSIIDLGGNVYVLGEYTVGVRSPFNPQSAFCTINLKDKSAVTSGKYQRYFEYEGKRYHHLIDPKSGFPAENGIASVTVISPSSTVADALSTAIFIKGEEALSLCSLFEDTDALIIMENKEIKTTKNFEEKYNLKK